MTAPRVLILASALDASPRCVHLDRPTTIAEVVAIQQVSLAMPTIAVLTDPAGNSRPVLRGEWHLRQVTAGYQLSFVPVPGRGSFGSILAAIAGIALAIVAPWAAGALAGLMGFQAGTTAFALASGLIGTGIMVAGQFLINRLMPRPAAGPTSETVYSARASGNRAMPHEVVPNLYGRLRYPPPYASRPYAEFVDNDQYLYQLHCLGTGKVVPERWEIGETLVWQADGGFAETFDTGDTEIEIVYPGQDITLFPANVVTASTVSGQQVEDGEWLGPFTVNPAGTSITRIVCDYVFPMGLVQINDDGGASSLSREVTAEYQAIDDQGAALGGWEVLTTNTHSASTRTPQRFSRGDDVPAGRYQVRLRASGTDTTDATGSPPTRLNRVVWGSLRGYLEGFETPPDVTLVATRVRANEQLSNEASGQYFYTCQRHLPTWTVADGWSEPQATRNPAWAAADLLKRLGLSDTEYDLGWLALYAGVWDDRGDRFDAVFDRRWQASEALDAILRVGRAYHVRLGSIIGFVRDEPRQVRRIAFTPDTIVRGSIRRHDVWFSEDAPDHLEVTFIDGETWRERSVIAAIGAVGEDKPQELPIFGITDHDHAWREGIFQTAENAYRRSFRTFQVEREGRMLVRGDAVVLHEPLLEGQEFARLDDRAGDVLTLDRVPEVDPAETYHVSLRDKRGREWGPCLVSSIDGATVTLDSADRAVVELQHGSLNNVLPDPSKQERAHVALLKGEIRLFDGLVVEARPVGSELWEVTLVNDDQRVHTVDETEVKPAPWTPPSMVLPPPEAPVIEGLYANVSRGTLGVLLQAGWQSAVGAERYVAEISYDLDAADEPDEASWTPIHDSKAARFSVAISPQPVTVRVAGIGKLQGGWRYATVTSIPSVLFPPSLTTTIVEQVNTQVGTAIERATRRSREAIERVQELWLDDADLAAHGHMQVEKLRESTVLEFGRTRAYVDREIVLAVGPDSAIVQQLNRQGVEIVEGLANVSQLVITQVNALSGSLTAQLNSQRSEYLDGFAIVDSLITTQVERIDDELVAMSDSYQSLVSQIEDVRSEITVSAETVAGPGGGIARYIVYVGVDDVPAGFLVESDGVNSSFGVFAGRFFVVDPSDLNTKMYPVIIESGVLTAQFGRIKEATVDLLKTPTNKARFGLLAPGVEGLEIIT